MSKSVTTRGNSWEAQVRHPSLPNGRIRKAFKTEHDAVAWAASADASLKNGTVPDMRMFKGKTKVNTLLDAYNSVVKHRWSGTRSEQTHAINMNTALDYFGSHRPLNEVDETTIDDFVLHLRGQQKSDATINRKLSALSTVLRHAYKRGWIERKPAIERRTERLTRISYYTKEQQCLVVDTFNSVGDNDFANLFVFLCDTGLRLGEALKLSFDDIRKLGDSGRAVFVHGGRQANSPARTIPLTTQANQAVSQGDTNQDGPFTHLSKRNVRTAWERLRKILDKTGDKDFIWHTCRHTFCSLLIQAGESLPVVAQLAGHKSISTTMRYSHLSPLNSVAAIQKLEALT